MPHWTSSPTVRGASDYEDPRFAVGGTQETVKRRGYNSMWVSAWILPTLRTWKSLPTFCLQVRFSPSPLPPHCTPDPWARPTTLLLLVLMSWTTLLRWNHTHSICLFVKSIFHLSWHPQESSTLKYSTGLPSLSKLDNSPSYVHTTCCLFVHPQMDTQVASALRLPNSSMNMSLQISVLVSAFNSCGYIPSSEIAGSYGDSIDKYFFRNHNTVFHKSLLFFGHHFAFSPAVHKFSNFSTSLPALVSFWGFNVLIATILSSLKAKNNFCHKPPWSHAHNFQNPLHSGCCY